MPSDLARNEQIYPSHIHEPLRRQIAIEVLEKEFYKLLPIIAPEQYSELNRTIAGWWGEGKHELVPIHDFWNGFDGIVSDFKLKTHLVSYLTAVNIAWSQENVSPDSLRLIWKPILPKELVITGLSIKEIDRALSAQPELRQDMIDNSDAHAKWPERDHFPILLLAHDDEFEVLDGNRRALRAYLYKKSTITAWVARSTDNQPPRDFWVSTAYLRKLVSEAARAWQERKDSEIAEATKTLLKDVFRQSQIAKINFELRVREKFPQFIQDFLD